MVITYFVGQMGATALATFSYAMQLSMIMMMLGMSIGIGTEIIIGHMVGAGEFDAAYRQLLRSLRVGLGVTVRSTCSVVLAAPSAVCDVHQQPGDRGRRRGAAMISLRWSRGAPSTWWSSTRCARPATRVSRC
jgi:hypothetical protein